MQISAQPFSGKPISLPCGVHDRQLVVALLVHDPDGLLDRERGSDAQGGAQLQGRHLLVAPPEERTCVSHTELMQGESKQQTRACRPAPAG